MTKLRGNVQFPTTQPATIESEKLRLDELRPRLVTMDEEIAELDLKIDAAKENLVSHESEQQQIRGSLNDLFENKKRLASELSAAKQNKADIYQQFKTAQEQLKVKEHEMFLKREILRKSNNDKRREEKLMELAEKELDIAVFFSFIIRKHRLLLVKLSCVTQS
jgi:chromosome segregation ATPase